MLHVTISGYSSIILLCCNAAIPTLHKMIIHSFPQWQNEVIDLREIQHTVVVFFNVPLSPCFLIIRFLNTLLFTTGLSVTVFVIAMVIQCKNSEFLNTVYLEFSSEAILKFNCV